MKKIILISLFLISSTFQSVSALNAQVESAFSSFLSKIESKYSLEVQESILESVRSKGSELRWSAETKTSKKNIFQDLLELNNEALYDTWKKKEENISSLLLQEQSIRTEMKRELVNQDISGVAEKLLSNGNVELLIVDSKREFSKGETIQMLEYSQYFPVNDNYSSLKNKKGLLVIDTSGEERLVENYKYVEKIAYSKLIEKYRGLLSDNNKVKREGNNYIAYNFNTFRFFEDDYGVYESQLITSGFSDNSTLIYRSADGRYNFVSDYDSHIITSIQSIFGVSEKHLFLDYLRDDSKFPTSDIEEVIKEMRSIATKLRITSQTQGEYVVKIYDWVLDNINYSEVVNLNDEKIFSAIETFKNKDGVCTGYTKLMSYMLFLGGIYDAQVVRGHVIDAQDFPQIGHAWIRLGDKYYDPTFDDPIGAGRTKTRDEYKYFGLPKDIFYANRFDYGDMPEGFEKSSDEEIQKYIFNYLLDLSPKYGSETSNYAVFGPVVFRNTYNIAQSTTITPELLASKIGSYKVDNNSFKFIQNGVPKSIKNFRFYGLSTDNTEQILSQLNYDTDELYLFDWQKDDGSREWRLAYEIDIR